MCAVGSSAIAAPPHHVDGGFRNVPEVARAGIDVTLPFFARRVVGDDHRSATAPRSASRTTARSCATTRATARRRSRGSGTRPCSSRWTASRSSPIRSGPSARARSTSPARSASSPRAVALAALPPIDFVVVSHSHYDHTDLPTLAALAATGARIFVPLELGRVLRERRHHRRRGARLVGPPRRSAAVKVHCVPAQHWSARSLFDKDETLWSGWAVTGPTRRFYFAGDTGYFNGFAEIGAKLGGFDLAALRSAPTSRSR
jgi:hypothetical protein